MGITLKNSEVIAAINDLAVPARAKASGSFKLKLARMTAVLRADVDRINPILQDLQKEFMLLDERGNPVPQFADGKPVPNTVTWIDRAACEVKINEFLAETHEFAITPFTVAEIEALELDGSIEGLLPLIAS